MTPTPSNLPTIGRKTYVDLLDFDMNNVAVKVDTGAYHNAIHCSHVEVITEGKKKYLQFRILDSQHPQYKDRLVTVSRFGKKRVVNSFGQSQTRYLVRLSFRINGINKIYKMHFTLADRSRMRTPVLLGRKFLRHRFIVDVRHTTPIQ